MSVSNHFRPSEDQIIYHYECDTCGKKIELESCYSCSGCQCGGEFEEKGESYPSDASEWNEQRDPDGEWRERRY